MLLSRLEKERKEEKEQQKINELSSIENLVKSAPRKGNQVVKSGM